MVSKRQPRQALEQAFGRKRVLDWEALQAALGTVSDSTIFRDLVKVGYLTSYSHTARYYALKQTPEFNEDGLWEWNGVLFSKWSTLRATIAHMVNEAPAGQTHAELQVKVRLRVHDTLHDLLTAKEIARIKPGSCFVYVSVDTETAQAQIRQREIAESVPPTPVEPQIVIGILLAFIEHPEEGVPQLAVRLRRRGVTQEQVDKVFRLYELEKKTAFRYLLH